MATGEKPDAEVIGASIGQAIAAHWKLALIQGAILAILGLLAVAMPFFSTLAVEVLIGWLFLFGGVLRAVSLVRAKHIPGYWWSLVAAIVAAVLGLVLIAAPLRGILTLTMVLMALFLVEGVSAIFAALDFRRHSSHWGWLLISGVIDLVLVFLIWRGWPTTAHWAIGLLTGINLFFMGLSLVMLALAARRSGERL